MGTASAWRLSASSRRALSNMGPQRAEALRFAGLLHDIGKLGIPTRILQTTDSLSERGPRRDLAAPRAGDGDGSRDRLPRGVRAGHPAAPRALRRPRLSAGLVDETASTSSAGVIAVADAFDSMTTTSCASRRPDRGRGALRAAPRCGTAASTRPSSTPSSAPCSRHDWRPDAARHRACWLPPVRRSTTTTLRPPTSSLSALTPVACSRPMRRPRVRRHR